jgi:thioredoxin-like negative regulator of GroEL
MASDERIKALKEFLAKDPDDAFSRYALALEYRSFGESENAVAELEELVRRDSKYLAAYQQLGQIFHTLNKTTEAKRYYRRGIEVAEEVNDIHAKREMEEELEEIEDEW